MPRNLRDDNPNAMRQLGDFPIDHGQQEPTRETAMAKALKPWGYRPPPAEAVIRNKYAQEIRADVGGLLREREMLEGTNLISQQHPIHDSPFFSKDIHFSARQTILGVDAVFTVDLGDPVTGRLNQHFVCFIRQVLAEVFDATADNDLRIRALVSNNLQEGWDGIRPSSLLPTRQNSYIRVMQNESLVFLVRNTNLFVPHDCQIRVHGWRYPVADIKETARGTIPKES